MINIKQYVYIYSDDEQNKNGDGYPMTEQDEVKNKVVAASIIESANTRVENETEHNLSLAIWIMGTFRWSHDPLCVPFLVLK